MIHDEKRGQFGIQTCSSYRQSKQHSSGIEVNPTNQGQYFKEYTCEIEHFLSKKKFKSHEIERIYGSNPLLSSLSMNNYAEDKTLGKIDLYNIKNFLHKLQKKFNKVFELLVLQLNFNKVGRKKIENIFHTIEASGSLLFIQRRNCFEQ